VPREDTKEDQMKTELPRYRIWHHQMIIAAVAAVVMFANLGGSRLWDRDEPRNAGCALEMQQRGDWIVPVFNAELRAHKPVLLYWLIMSAYSVFGVNEFAARFWSALLAVGTALATYHIGRRLFSAQVGLWAGVILATSLMFDVAGRAATPDSALIFFATLALMVYVLSTRPAEGLLFPDNWVSAAAMYGVMGVAVLAKGPVGFVLPTAVIGMFLLIMRLPELPQSPPKHRWLRALWQVARPFQPLHFLRTCWFMRPITAVVVVSAVAVPWYVWVGLRTDGQFLREFFLEHNLGRAARSMEGHSGSVLFYPVAILAGFFPWSVFAAPTVIGAARRIRRRDPWYPGYVLAMCWVAVYVALFSMARTKLPSYVTPCYPALALLTGCFIHHWTGSRALSSAWWPKIGLVILGFVGLVIVVAIPVATIQFLPGEAWLGAIGLVPLCGAGCALILIARNRLPAAAATVAATAAVFTTSLFAIGAWRVSRHQENHLLLAAIDRVGGDPQIGAFRCLEPTWIFYGGRPIAELALGPSGHRRHRRTAGPGKSRPHAGDFFGDGDGRLIITTGRHWEELQRALPHDATVLAECSFFLKSERLLLVGKPAADRTARVEPRPATDRR
jgi:4-amino-4-deoxy-L-arabinose transferase-like glycosyltransferase